jgi:hypothetical protein
MSYRIAGIDVHKKMLAVVVADVEVEGKYRFERRKFGSNPEHLRLLAEWLLEPEVKEVVMESTAQYWQPAGRGGRPGSGFGAADHCRSRSHGRHFSFRQAAVFLGSHMPGWRRERRSEHSHRSPKGNRQMRRILNQAANAAVKMKGSVFQIVYHRLVPRMGHNQAICAIAYRLCKLIWILLHRQVRYEERGPAVAAISRRKRTDRMVRELRKLGYQVETAPIQPFNWQIRTF